MNKKAFTFLFILILIIGIIPRVYQFGSLPNGVNVDEASSGYDAFAMLHYGIDMNGYKNPVVLVSFGSGHASLSTYLSMPFIALLGLNQVSIRLVNVIFGILSLLVFYLLVRKVEDERTALIAMFLLAINPWHIMISRWGLDCNLFPAIFLIATCLLVYSDRHPLFFPLAMATYGLSLYAYATSYFFLPVFFLLTLWKFLKNNRIGVRNLLVGFSLLLVISLPTLLYLIINTFQMEPIQTSWISIPRTLGPTRYLVVSSLFSGGNFFKEFIQNAFWLVKVLLVQDDTLIMNAVPGYGTIYLFGAPFMLVGLWVVMKEQIVAKKYHPRLIFLTWMLAAIALGLVMLVSINRINIIYLPIIYLMAKAIVFLLHRARVLALASIALFLVGFVCFNWAYFGEYIDLVNPAFNEGLHQAIDYATEKSDGLIFISRTIHVPYIHVLFSQKIDPHDFLENVVYVDITADTRDASAYGRYRFVNMDNITTYHGTYIIEYHDKETLILQNFSVKQFQRYYVLFS